MHVLGMTDQTRSRGRKARGYVPIKTIDGVRQMMLDDFLHPN